MPDEDAVAPAPAAIDFGKRFAEGQHPVIAGEIEPLQGVGIADGAVVGIVEQKCKAASALPQMAERGDHARFVPLVHDDDVASRDEPPHVFAVPIGR